MCLCRHVTGTMTSCSVSTGLDELLYGKGAARRCLTVPNQANKARLLLKLSPQIYVSRKGSESTSESKIVNVISRWPTVVLRVSYLISFVLRRRRRCRALGITNKHFRWLFHSDKLCKHSSRQAYRLTQEPQHAVCQKKQKLLLSPKVQADAQPLQR